MEIGFIKLFVLPMVEQLKAALPALGRIGEEVRIPSLRGALPSAACPLCLACHYPCPLPCPV